MSVWNHGLESRVDRLQRQQTAVVEGWTVCHSTSATMPHYATLLMLGEICCSYFFENATWVRFSCNTVQYSRSFLVSNPLDSGGNYSATSNNTKLVHYTGRCGPGRAAGRLAVPNVTAHPSTASVPITVLLYDGSLLCRFDVAIKRLKHTDSIGLHSAVRPNANSERRGYCYALLPSLRNASVTQRTAPQSRRHAADSGGLAANAENTTRF